jgi:two-component system OmpR family response regulator
MSHLILVIEDDFRMREVLTEALAIDGYRIECAENGEIGLQKIFDLKPDLVLCDLGLPKLDGLTLIDKLRKRPEFDSLPFIIITALDPETHMRKGMNLGADDYLSKPFSITELLTTVKARLNRIQNIKKSALGNVQKEVSINHLLTLLTPSELGIIKLIASGNTSIDIAQKLQLSAKTVENHRHNMAFKLDLKGKNSLLHFALNHKRSIQSYRG